MDRDLIYGNALNTISTLGVKRLTELKTRFGDFETAWNELSERVLSDLGLDNDAITNSIEQRKKLSPEELWEPIETHKVTILTPTDASYPLALREIPTPPPLLYVRGAADFHNDVAIAVVGTRTPSPYGRIHCERIVRELASQGVTIVSGLAYGIDAIAHQATLEAAGRTIAVLGSGIDSQSIYPPSHNGLAEKIIERGGNVISEYPLGTAPLRHHFPARNRIISGFSKAVLVVEAREKSGALLTARDALDQNRDVFALPGDVNRPQAAGPNRLIRMGAKLIINATDVLSELNVPLAKAQQALGERTFQADTKEEAAILTHLTDEPIHVDELAEACALPAASVTATLTLMEMKGKVKNMGAMQYVRIR
ncbi:MAG: DNA-protecting protein DprA [Parcubacteria group bacterium]|nr:DNA-protecting protein DprA [Parcubacteria group bacterium]